jgi:hypothetical protein
VVAVGGLIWYVNLLVGVLGGAGEQAQQHAAGGVGEAAPGLREAFESNPTPSHDLLAPQPLAVADLGRVVEEVRVRARAELAEVEEIVVVAEGVNDLVGEDGPGGDLVAASPGGLWGQAQIVFVRLRSYWPDDGPDWCLVWDEESGQCVSPTTAGDDWRVGDGALLACPADWLGCQLRVVSAGLELPCSDTGVTFACAGRECVVGLVASAGEVSGLHSATLRCPLGVG